VFFHLILFQEYLTGEIAMRVVEEVKEIVENLGYVLLYEYMDKNHRKVVIQDKIGYKYDTRLEHIINGHIPNFVDIHNSFVLENIILLLFLTRPDFRLCDNNVYEGSSEKLNLFHNTSECQEYFKESWKDIFSGKSCGICDGRQAGSYNNLAYLRPDLAEEWSYERNDIRPEEVTCGSNKKVWWICPYGHEYFSMINSRTKGTGCRQCSDKQKESFIAMELKKWCQETFKHLCDPEHKMFKNTSTNHWLRCDIYLGDKESVDGVYIEIHGGQHYVFIPYYHKSQQDFKDSRYRDKIKKQYAKKHGVYIEVDLRKISGIEEAIEYIKNIIGED